MFASITVVPHAWSTFVVRMCWAERRCIYAVPFIPPHNSDSNKEFEYMYMCVLYVNRAHTKTQQNTHAHTFAWVCSVGDGLFAKHRTNIW